MFGTDPSALHYLLGGAAVFLVARTFQQLQSLGQRTENAQAEIDRLKAAQQALTDRLNAMDAPSARPSPDNDKP